MDTKLAGVLYSIRDAYVATFEAFLVDLRAIVRHFVVEPEIRDSDGEPLRKGELDAIVRHDVLAKTLHGSMKAFAVDSEKLIEFPNARFREGELDVGIAPFLWESMEVWTDGPRHEVSKALAGWFRIAATPLASTSHETTQGVAHFISDPCCEHGLTSCVVDLGTAPVEAVIMLLGYLELAGARRVDLGQFQRHHSPVASPQQLADG